MNADDTTTSRPSADRPLDEQVRHRVDEHGVAWIVLDRPDVKNAVSPDQRNRMIELLEHASEHLAVRAVVITATGNAFCTGADLRAAQPVVDQPEGAPDQPPGRVSLMIRRGAQRLVAAVLDCEKPVIVAMNGTAAGIGAHIVLAADLVIAAEGARFIEVFMRRALVPDGGGAYLLPRIIGLHKAKQLMLLADDVSPEEALALGIVNKVVPAEELTAATETWAQRLAQGPTQALARTKALLNASLSSDRATSFAEESWAQEHNMGTHDAQEGVAAFVERRKPDFLGW